MKKNRKTQRPSDDRVAGGIPTAGEVKVALAIFEKLPRPTKPPVKR